MAADPSRPQFSAVRTLTVTSTPETHLAFTNIAYCSASDLRNFSVPGTADLFLANVAGVLILSLSDHERVHDGTIALNAVQRRYARVSTDDIVTVTRFVPPENFDLTLLALVKKGTKAEEVDAVLLSTQLRTKFINQVMPVSCMSLFSMKSMLFARQEDQAGMEQVSMTVL